MKIVCISASQIPSDTANSIQAMKTCQALAQLGHAVTLLVPGHQPVELRVRWLARRHRYSVHSPTNACNGLRDRGLRKSAFATKKTVDKS